MPAPVPKEDVLEDIRRVAEKLDKVPTRAEYAEHGEYSEITPRLKCGSWTKARQEAGLEGGPTQNTWTTEEKLKNDLRRVAEEIGESPSQEQYNDHGKYSHKLVYDRLGSWNEAIESIGFEPYTQDISDEALIEDLRQLGRELERVPSQTDLNAQSEHSVTTYQRRFGKWSYALRKAGFEPRTVGPGTGEQNPAWAGGYDPYYGPNWEDKKVKIRERDGECMLCGISRELHQQMFDERLSVHHIVRFEEFDDYRVANRDRNLIALCRSCHSQIDEHDCETREKLKKLVG